VWLTPGGWHYDLMLLAMNLVVLANRRRSLGARQRLNVLTGETISDERTER
jgi:hypothetical protein